MYYKRSYMYYIMTCTLCVLKIYGISLWPHLLSRRYNVRGLSGKFADTANKTRNMYPRLKKFCINKYQLSSTNYT